MELSELRELQKLTLSQKIPISQTRILEWCLHWKWMVYVSFSGGKDSTVLLDLVCRVWASHREEHGDAELHVVFVDTGLEYPEIKEFVKQYIPYLIEKYGIKIILHTLNPKMNFYQVLKKVGYPLIDKKTARKIHDLRHPTAKNEATRKLITEGIKRDGTKSKNFLLSQKWKFLIAGQIEISNKCCAIMKHSPFGIFERRTKRKPFVGDMADDGNQRESTYLKHGCNNYRKTRPMSQPMGFWTNQDVLECINIFKIPYCNVYGEIILETKDGINYRYCTGVNRTGCMFCLFGVHLESKDKPNRFQKMMITHPKRYKYCIEGGQFDENGMWGPSEKGLGIGFVLDYIGIPYGKYNYVKSPCKGCQQLSI